MEKQPLNSAANKPPPYSVATAPNMYSTGKPLDDHATCHGMPSCPPPPGYYPTTPLPTAQGNSIPSYGSTLSTIIAMPEIILVGGCPACRVGIMEDDYTCLGLLCAILCFPFGIICCLLLKTRRCSNCGAYFG